ncbi:MAG: hypothetical protein RBT41_07645 [Clostridia bacterium]|nr:hypothetical protein [Clostridia bacterium]
MKTGLIEKLKNIRTLEIGKWKRWGYLLPAVLLVWAGFYAYGELTQLPPQEAVLQGLAKTINTPSYRYHAVAVRNLDGQETLISEVSGEKNLQGVHLKGNLPIIQAEVEVYHLGDTLFRRDSLTDGWVVVPEQGRPAVEQLIAEINPLGAFHFTEQDNIVVKRVGKESIRGKSCRIYEVMGRGVNEYMALYWQDFNYRLWIDKKDGVIRRAEVLAEHRDNSLHHLKITVEMMDFNETIEIQPPQT